MKLYRQRYLTMYDRADLYVPFYERGLSLLAEGGRLGFICANRWIKNKYGGPLRRLVSQSFHLESYIDFTDCPAFQSEVIAYPAVTIIRRGKGENTRVSHRPKVDSATLRPLASRLVNNEPGPNINDSTGIVSGSSPWLLDNPERLKVIRRLENKFLPLEEGGCRVGIGVATGIDKVFIRPDKDLPVEPDRKLPILMTKDVQDGEIRWGGNMVLNPFDGETKNLIELQDFPKFAQYINQHQEAISRRHAAKKNPDRWYKTIDRIYPSLTTTPKLLIPDIKGKASVVFDHGQFYPHHNFYYVVSDSWDLRALQAVLLSRVTQAFISTYSLWMRGDFLRYQAQYLRRIRLPDWQQVDRSLKKRLANAGKTREMSSLDAAVQEFYGLDDTAWQQLCPQ